LQCQALLLFNVSPENINGRTQFVVVARSARRNHVRHGIQLRICTLAITISNYWVEMIRMPLGANKVLAAIPAMAI
jgi:hypothetical protein